LSGDVNFVHEPREDLVPFGTLDFVYQPSRDVVADMAHYVGRLGAEILFAIEAFGTRVAMVRVGDEPPAILLAEHLEGETPVLLYRVDDLAKARADLESRGAELGPEFGFPAGEGVEILLPGPQRVAIYEETRPDRVGHLAGRRDF
jgi:hypothetical protein